MFIRATRGLKIRDHLTKLLIPDEGCNVVDSPFWQRRLRDGDAEIVLPPDASFKPAAKAAPVSLSKENE
jgi:hypothetical protein